MMPVIIIVVLIGAVLSIGGLLGWFTVKRIRRTPPEDVERILNADVPRYTPDGAIVMRDLPSGRDQRIESVPQSQIETVPSNVAPVATPLKKPTGEIKGVGGGFVKYFKFGKRKNKHESESESEDDDVDEDVHRETKGKERKSVDNFENADLYGGPSWEPKRGELEQPGLYEEPEDIPAPKPIYTSTNYGRYDSKTATNNPRIMVLRDDGRAADVWDKINKRVPLVHSRPSSRVKPDAADDTSEQNTDGFQEINLGSDSKKWKEAKRPATPVAKYSVGSDPDSSRSDSSDSDDDESGSDDNDLSKPTRPIESPQFKYGNEFNAPDTVPQDLYEDDIRENEMKLTFEDKSLNRISESSVLTYASTNSSQSKASSNKKPSPRSSTRHASFDDGSKRRSLPRTNTSPQHMPSISELQRPTATIHPLINRPSMADSGFTSKGSSETSFDRSFADNESANPVSKKASWSTEGSNSPRKSGPSRSATPIRNTSKREEVAKPARKASKASVKKKVVLKRESGSSSLAGYADSDEE
ncbi:hypothetical protein CC86DRAFT_420606 [Ophiobolus disseminans]|uniref:Uncharacterized protein n=1 Tax=Ophiobolus disseminans TaxID=1469910 RepID=A0A6A6ZV04_9PLEO|nr:hypothetical protein CC86DRAFT_420606 [Ophiobolus disseminans]